MAVIDFIEARKDTRQNALDMALISAGEMSVCCVIRSLTGAGAALEVGPQTDPPDQFTLIVVAKRKTYSCNVVGRESCIGVRFTLNR